MASLLRGTPEFTNRLIAETSPYLLQHAHNPVDWYAWGDEPFDEARRAGRPVFLSVGYSTCHWCHVMEEESFEDLEIARVLNEQYVAIKVDREERPDIDAVYMAAVQSLAGTGGWPMSVWLTPDREPFFGGTYFPARDGDRGAAQGFLSILRQIAEIYRSEPDRIRGASASLVAAVREAVGSGSALRSAPGLPGQESIEKAVASFKGVFDDRFGGVRGAPKFPASLPVGLLLRYHQRTQDPVALGMATLTLEQMAAGGIFDQLAGGFHRYSTDSSWLVPHFEKMLYDNAQLAVVYAQAHQVTGRADFARVTRQILDYLLREMRSEDGGFFSATDADSEGEEGRFFVWSEEEIRGLLGKDADRFDRFYGVTEGGNFEGKNILHVPHPDENEWRALQASREILLAERGRRVAPLRDEKILSGWNGLAISAMASGGRLLGEPKYVSAAEQAADFVLSRMRPAGRLLRSFGAGQARIPGYLDDHAFLAQGLLDLHDASLDPRWLEEARALCETVEEQFADRDGGGWFRTGEEHERLIAREKPSHGGAEPSGSSVALLNALRLARHTNSERWRTVIEKGFRCYALELDERPAMLSDMLLAVDLHADGAGYACTGDRCGVSS